jgi:hypothetical protein
MPGGSTLRPPADWAGFSLPEMVVGNDGASDAPQVPFRVDLRPKRLQKGKIQMLRLSARSIAASDGGLGHSKARFLAGAILLVLLASCQATPTPSSPTPSEPVLSPPVTPSVFADCVDFEDLAVDTVYVPGETIATGSVVASVQPFVFSTGAVSTGGHGIVSGVNLAGGAGKELQSYNVQIRFDVNPPIDGATLLFSENGGNVNLVVNDDLANKTFMRDVDGTSVGRVAVKVAMSSATNGELTLDGEIKSFAIGGGQFMIDHVCPVPRAGSQIADTAGNTVCVDFEDRALGDRFAAGDTYTSGPASVKFDNRPSSSGGSAAITSGSSAGSSGNALATGTLMTRFRFGGLADHLTIRYGDRAGRSGTDFLEVDGAGWSGRLLSALASRALGDVTFHVTDIVTDSSGNETGVLVGDGRFDSVAISGDELFIDDVCARVVDPH